MFEKYENELSTTIKISSKVENMPTQTTEVQEAAIIEGESDLRSRIKCMTNRQLTKTSQVYCLPRIYRSDFKSIRKNSLNSRNITEISIASMPSGL